MPGSSATARPEPHAPAKAALVVAAYEFDDPKFQRLRSPARDVEALADVLDDAAIGGFAVQTVVNQPSSIVQQEIERFFSERKPDDLLLLYFSCHGVKDGTGRLYFATTNTRFELLRSTGVSASFVSEQMELTRSKRIVLLLDCCYSGAFLKGFRARSDDAVSVSQLEGRGRAVITASRATEYAFEADELTATNAQPSVFTGAIIEGLASGDADRDRDGSVTVDELYDYVYDSVRGKVAGQTPGRWVNLEGELVIARNPRPPVRPAALSAEMTKAVESEVALHRLGAVWQLKDWLDGDDPGRQLTARKVLETLADDYDERVKSAAFSVLARNEIAAAAATETATATDSATSDAPDTAEPQAPPVVEPAPAPAVVASAPEPPLVKPAPVPSDGEPLAVPDRLERIIGLAIVVALVTLVLALFVPFVTFDDQSSERLADDNWNELFVLALGALTGYAALCLLGQGLSAATGKLIVVGMTPAVLTFGLFGITPLTDDYLESVGPGFVLMELSCITFLVAGVLARGGLRGRFTVVWSWAARPVVLAGAALVGGIVASAAWGDVYDIESGPMWNLLSRLVVVTVVVCVFADWLRDHAAGPLRIAATGLVYTGIVLAFMAESDLSEGHRVVLSSQYVVLVSSAIVVPLLAVVLRPSPAVAILLATWSVSLVAQWFGVMVDGVDDGYHRGSGTVVVLLLLAALPLALHLHRSPTSRK